LVLATSLLSGCGLPGGSSGTTPATTAAAPSAGSSAASASGSGTPAPAASAAPADLPVIAQATTSGGKNLPLRISLNRLTVSGELLQLTFSVTNTGAPEKGHKFQVAQFFADGVSQTDSAFSTADAFTVDGVYLLDPKNAKRYLVARNANRVCVCSGHLSDTFIGAGTTNTFSATFKAPPADVTTMTVVIPKTAPFENVPVQR
jgi:hypothetical protein